MYGLDSNYMDAGLCTFRKYSKMIYKFNITQFIKLNSILCSILHCSIQHKIEITNKLFFFDLRTSS